MVGKEKHFGAGGGKKRGGEGDPLNVMKPPPKKLPKRGGLAISYTKRKKRKKPGTIRSGKGGKAQPPQTLGTRE